MPKSSKAPYTALLWLFVLLIVAAHFQGEHAWLWKSAVFVQGFGHLFAAVGLVAGARAFFRRYYTRSAALIGCSLILALPALEAYRRSPEWRRQLEERFGTSARLADIRLHAWALIRPTLLPADPQTLAYPISATAQKNLYYYRAISVLPAPFVVVVHGGGWDSGDPRQLPELNRRLNDDGVAVFAVQYRLSTEAPWPAQRDDVLAALDWIRANAADLGVDPEKYALLGRSAGGHIAEAVAYQKPRPGLRGLVAFYAPSDLKFGYEVAEPHDLIESRALIRTLLIGAPEKQPELYRDASPLEFVTGESVPTLLLHGESDPLTWVRHSDRLEKALSERGVPVGYLRFERATHGFDYALGGPYGQISTAAIRYFLDQRFKAPPPAPVSPNRRKSPARRK